MAFDVVTTLRDLVAIPSVNPMGRAVEGPQYYEYKVTDYLEQLFARLKIPTWRQSIAPRRDNLIARIDGNPSPEQGGALLLLEAHQDTVPVEGMSIPPFDPQVRDSRLYGRGSCDIKGGMTAMLAVMARLAEERGQHPHPGPLPGGEGDISKMCLTVVMACTVNEEHGFTGATGLCKLWASELNVSGEANQSNKAKQAAPSEAMIPRRPDAAIIAEPTNLNVVVAHKGMVRWRCHTGRAAHSSKPELGENAVFRMAKVLAALEVYQREVVGCLANHPLCGRPTLSVGTISGGLSVNTVPDRCTIEIDRRLAPGEDPQLAWRHVIEFVETQTAFGDYVIHDPPVMQSRGLNDTHNKELAIRMDAAVRASGSRIPNTIGVPFGTDAAIIAGAGVPCVVFGPGSIEQAHTADEWVPLAEVEQVAEALYRLVAEWGENNHEQ